MERKSSQAEHFANLEPHNPSTHSFYIVQKRQPTDFEAEDHGMFGRETEDEEGRKELTGLYDLSAEVIGYFDPGLSDVKIRTYTYASQM